MCPIADTALAATSNCPAPKYFVQTSDSATLSAQSRFHVGTEKKKEKRGVGKKKNPVTLTFALSHSPTSQMQRPMSSEGSSEIPIRRCQGRCSQCGWNGCRNEVNKTLTKEKKTNKIPGFRQVLAFLHTGSIPSFIPVFLFCRITQLGQGPLDWLPPRARQARPRLLSPLRLLLQPLPLGA